MGITVGLVAALAACGPQSNPQTLLDSMGPNPDTAADLTSVLCLVGSVFAVISRYAVLFWNQGLHQGSSLSMDQEEHVADVYAWPLWTAIIGFGLLFVSLVLIRTRTEIRSRRLRALEARERMA